MMKLARLIPLIAIVAFVAGFWAACSIGFDPTGSEHIFTCNEDDDCLSPNVCVGGKCQSADGPANCNDQDGDGYGTGTEDERAGCELCQMQARCEEDCNDNDADVNPGLQETCDGKDNDCDGEIDEPLECGDGAALGCPDEGSGIPGTCDDGVCVYKPSNQLAEGCNITLDCVDGMRETPPAQCQ